MANALNGLRLTPERWRIGVHLVPAIFFWPLQLEGEVDDTWAILCFAVSVRRPGAIAFGRCR